VVPSEIIGLLVDIALGALAYRLARRCEGEIAALKNAVFILQSELLDLKREKKE